MSFVLGSWAYLASAFPYHVVSMLAWTSPAISLVSVLVVFSWRLLYYVSIFMCVIGFLRQSSSSYCVLASHFGCALSFSTCFSFLLSSCTALFCFVFMCFWGDFVIIYMMLVLHVAVRVTLLASGAFSCVLLWYSTCLYAHDLIFMQCLARYVFRDVLCLFG